MSHPRKVKGFYAARISPQPAIPQKLGGCLRRMVETLGKLVSGWWFDGYKTEMRDSYEDLKKEKYNIDTWIKPYAGNPMPSLPSMPVPTPLTLYGGKLCPHQTFTSGENHSFYQRPKKIRPSLDPKNFPPHGVVWHLLLPVSNGWGSGNTPKFDLETLTKGLVRLMRKVD